MPEATEPVQITRPKGTQNMGVKYITPFLFVHFLVAQQENGLVAGASRTAMSARLKIAGLERESPVNSRGEAANNTQFICSIRSCNSNQRSSISASRPFTCARSRKLPVNSALFLSL